MAVTQPLHFIALAESSLLVQIGDGRTIDPFVVDVVWALTAALDERHLSGVTDIVPAYATILISFDPEQTDPKSIEESVRGIAASLPSGTSDPERTVEIPVHYGGEDGPDLNDVAEHAHLTVEEVVARHAGSAYRVACGGFAPGWNYLMGLPPELAIPRLANPRTRIPPGSLGIGGSQTGVYPLETPGGWRLIGRTPLRMFDPDRAADPFLLHPGDGVTFRAIDRNTFAEIERDVAATVNQPDARFRTSNGKEHSQANGHRQERGGGGVVQVLNPGMLTTVQDLGRSGMARFGVAPGGALDRTALILGNRSLGNDPGEAALEITLIGPTLEFTKASAIAIVGADLGAQRNGRPVPLWSVVHLNPGDQLSFDPARAKGGGARAYLCVAGGFALEPTLGSRSTDLVGRFGGIDGRPLQSGDALSLNLTGTEARAVPVRVLAIDPPPYDDLPFIARITLGPQTDRFAEAGVSTFLQEQYTVSSKANRTGIRLSGPAIAHRAGADLVSEGIAHGAIQVPGDGQPIVLLAARQTVGGYVKIATVIGADLDRFAQLRPGATVRFTEVSGAEARAATIAARSALGPASVTEPSQMFSGWSAATISPTDTPRSTVEGMNEVTNRVVWNSAGVVDVLEAAQRTGVSQFRLEIAEIGLKLELTRDLVRREANEERGELKHPQESGPDGDTVPSSSTEDVITAPVLGVFYRRSTPEDPLLAEEGARVEAGQTIGLLEVMKTYHEVQAPTAGTLEAFLVEDGQFVEYGQPIARIQRTSNGSAS